MAVPFFLYNLVYSILIYIGKIKIKLWIEILITSKRVTFSCNYRNCHIENSVDILSVEAIPCIICQYLPVFYYQLTSALLQTAAFLASSKWGYCEDWVNLVKGTFGIVTSKEEWLGNIRNHIYDSLRYYFWNAHLHFIKDISCQLDPYQSFHNEFWNENDWNMSR